MSTHIATKKNTHTNETYCVWTNANNSSREMQTKFSAVEHRVKIKGHKQEDEYGYRIWDKAHLTLLIYFLLIQKMLATMSSPAD